LLVGPSGCGKSTTLRMIAGLEEVTSGDIYIDGEVVNDLPPKDRDIAMVFQNYALYPHMTAFENMSFGLRLRKFFQGGDPPARRARGAHPRHHRPAGRRPSAVGRTAPARRHGARHRAQPEGLPVDEPLSSRRQAGVCRLRTEIKRVHQKVKRRRSTSPTTQVEAMTLAEPRGGDEQGPQSRDSARRRLYHHPSTRFAPASSDRRR